MYDKELLLFKNKALTAAITSDVIDLGADINTTGQKPLYLVIMQTEEIEAATATVTFNLQESADNSTFTTVSSTGALTAKTLGYGVAIPLPAKCKRYLRVTTAVSSTAPTAGKATAYVFDKFTDPCVKMIEGY